ncbi:MAG TPA: DUF6526 family protein [Cytophagaceae bacterium]|jgi:hypothetical protein|nr:DUF6526 family protein [Cytophagaceae bacterium]
MAEQNYQNHRKWYPFHHLVLYPILGISIAISSLLIITNFDNSNEALQWFAIWGIFWLITASIFMLRQHYALGNQNRIIRLEMRFRYYRLTQKNFEEFEKDFKSGHIAALRFAPDQELLPLIDTALKEKLSPAQIKQKIKNWQADTMRV